MITELGGLPELAERPEPSGEAIYEVSTVSLNPIDVNVGAGRYFAGHPEFPYIPGCEGVGRAPDGTRVYLFGDGLGVARDGLLAERAAAPADARHPTPGRRLGRDRGFVRHRRNGRLDAGRVARARANGRPRARARCDRHRRARGHPGREAPRRRACRRGRPESRASEACGRARRRCDRDLEEDDLVAAFKEAAGGDGPTYIVDTLWGAPAVAAIQAASPGWRLVQIGQSAGAEAQLASAPVRGKMGEIYGYTDFAVPKDAFREHYLDLVGHAAAEKIVFDLVTYPLERIAEAWERQAAAANAKIVVTLA